MLQEMLRLGMFCWNANIVAAILALICVVMILLTFKRARSHGRLLYWLEVASITGAMATVFGYALDLVHASALFVPSVDSYTGWYNFMWGVGSTAVYWPIWMVGYLYSKIRRGIPSSDENHRNAIKTRAHQKLDPIVTTRVDEAEAQGTQGHP